MDGQYMCYCGLYCLNCAVKATVEPAARVLYKEMWRTGFEDIIEYMPNGKEFWAFLKSMAEDGTCVSCHGGSGNPGCAIRLCARDSGIEMCAFCKKYPCAHFDELFPMYPPLREDNAILRDKGMAAWASLQDERRARGFTYPDAREDSNGQKA